MKKGASAFEYGIRSEQIVTQYYIALGFKVIKQRYKSPYGEIDLIVVKPGLLVFVEVKARNKISHNEFITRRQIKRCTAAAQWFLATVKSTDDIYDLRFDLVVVIDKAISQVIENAWEVEE